MTIESVARHLERRASVREFTAAGVSQEVIDAILAGALRAPTSFNFQPYSIVVVRSLSTRLEIAEVSGAQGHVREAPVLLVVCADLARVRRWCGFQAEAEPIADLDLLVACVTDAAMAGMCASLVAESLGLGTVMIGGVRNDPHRVAELLALPPGVLPTFAMCLGYPAYHPAPRPRLNARFCVHNERYDAVAALEAAEYPEDGISVPGSGVVAPDDVAAWRDQLVRGTERAHRMARMARAARVPI
jgi:nitroreductase